MLVVKLLVTEKQDWEYFRQIVKIYSYTLIEFFLMDYSGGRATSTSGGASGGSVWIFTETADVTGMYLYLNTLNKSHFPLRQAKGSHFILILIKITYAFDIIYTKF
jgi:hypothetical protein